MMHNIDEVLARFGEIPTDKIPAVLSQLAAASQQLAARLLQNGNGAHAQVEDKLVSPKKAAQLIDLSVDWIYDHQDELPFVVKLPAAKTRATSGETKSHIRCSLAGIQRWI